MDRYSVNVPPRILAGLRREAGATAPAECCGALVGLRRGVELEIRTLIPVMNEASDHHRQYVIGAHTVLRLERQAACAGLQVVGFYHSHPGAVAEPSPLDLQLASPGYIYMIVAARDGAVRAWRLAEDRGAFLELPVSLLAGAA
jgi:proteasome lid subunit RPN8/RPN11